MHLRRTLPTIVLAGSLPCLLSAPADAAGSECAQITQADTPGEDSDAVSAPAEDLEYAALAAAAGGSPGAGVTVAVVGSGVSDPRGLLHRVPGAALGDTGEIVDSRGTIVASLITGPAQEGRARGIAPDARVVDVPARDSGQPGGNEGPVSTAAVLEGLRWVQQQRAALGIKVVVVAAWVPSAAGGGGADPLHDVVRALSNDVVIVAASGDRPGEDDPHLADFATPAPGLDAAGAVFPAGYPEVLAVSATASGEDASELVLPNSQTDVAAPTTGAVGYGLNGRSCTLPELSTSWAAGIVGGLAAVLVQTHPDETARQIVARIKATATGSADSPTMWTGSGVVQPMEAVTRDLEMTHSGRVLHDGLHPRSEPPLHVGSEPADPLAGLSGDLVWWGLLAGGVLGLAALLRPLIQRRTGRRTLPHPAADMTKPLAACEGLRSAG